MSWDTAEDELVRQDVDDIRGAQPTVDPDRQAFAGELLDQIEHAVLPAFVGPILDSTRHPLDGAAPDSATPPQGLAPVARQATAKSTRKTRSNQAQGIHIVGIPLVIW